MPNIGNENFDMLNRLLGWGDPDEGIWCIGIEEGVGYKNSDDIRRWTENGKKEFISVSAGEVQKAAQKRRSPYIEYPSKIAAELTTGPHRNKWKEYRDNILWRTGSKVCHANLYPLGKPRASEWPCDENLELFGLRRISPRQYREYVQNTRFKYIADSWAQHRPQATVCFGMTYWEDFRKLFGLLESGEEIACDGKVSFYRSSRIVLTTHFSRGHMSDKLAYWISDLLKNEWHVQLP